jgi:hypothetical protein
MNDKTAPKKKNADLIIVGRANECVLRGRNSDVGDFRGGIVFDVERRLLAKTVFVVLLVHLQHRLKECETNISQHETFSIRCDEKIKVKAK